jgi:alpha-glucosidase
VLGNHDVVRPVTRWGSAAARTAALLLLALPGSAYIYQGEELGLPEVTDIPPEARQDPTFRRTGGEVVGRDGSRVPLPWDEGGATFGFSATALGSPATAPWLPQPGGWGEHSVAAEDGTPGSFLTLYKEALAIRRRHPALGTGNLGDDAMRWLEAPQDLLLFARDPGFLFAANLGSSPLRLPEHRSVLLASEPLIPGAHGLSDGELPPGAGVWLEA